MAEAGGADGAEPTGRALPDQKPLLAAMSRVIWASSGVSRAATLP